MIRGANASGNGLYGNLIGTDATGSIAVPNGWHGVRIVESAHDNLIGGPSSEAANVISGNAHSGIEINGVGASGNIVNGNYHRPFRRRSDVLGNRYHGVMLSGGASDNLVINGYVSGNGANGIRIQDASTQSNRVAQVVIGTNAAASNSVGNQSLWRSHC